MDKPFKPHCENCSNYEKHREASGLCKLLKVRMFRNQTCNDFKNKDND